MARAQDQLDEAIKITKEAAGELDSELKSRAEAAVTGMEAQRDKFFFQSLAGLPLAVKANKAAKAISAGADEAKIAALEAIVKEIDDKADAPGTVLT